ncbi:MAG TPA: uracil-DNA glycosylase [Gammaproteobacteria bacterium]|nr:uracil-DNA glycosylase [Gammaproteobacteria bacterium]
MITYQQFNINVAHSSWHRCLNDALEKMDPDYLENLYCTTEWLPGHENIFNAFSIPLNQTQYILFGESPYPRRASANGYAFWDKAVTNLWSDTGLSKSVNRATSLRNIIKMLLIAEGKLNPEDTSQDAIAKLSKENLIKTNEELFQNFLSHGFLLLNAAPILRPNQVQKDARAWHAFIKHILNFIFETYPQTQLILLGNIANTIEKLISHREIPRLYAEHPYNISFIHNPKIIQFFQPLHLLRKNIPLAI